MTNPKRVVAATSALDAEGEYHIEAQSSLTERSLRTLKHGDAFAVLDGHGDLGTAPGTAEGIYFRDMRYLSRFELICSGFRPLMLSSLIHDNNAALSVDLTNADSDATSSGDAIPRDTIAISRTKFLWNETCYERIGLRNYSAVQRTITIELRFAADFLDLFEVRGMERQRRGVTKAETAGAATVRLSYDGLDGVQRLTALSFQPQPQKIDSRRAIFQVVLAAGERRSLIVTAAFSEGCETTTPASFQSAYRAKHRAIRADTAKIATVESTNSLFNRLMCRSTADIYTLLGRTNSGSYPYAGIPWYNTVFGRDGIITALLLLWIDPMIARGVLLHLAETQATHHNPSTDAQPGKILHEQRRCEMAALREVPFGQYYGTVDATPLFVFLAGAYYERTQDRSTLERIWPNVKAALRWCDEFGDRDGDGFVEYLRETPAGLANQGWKDSHDSIFHADGALADGAIALVEVQAYVYGAKLKAALLAREFDEADLADRLITEAQELRARFESAFWCEEIGTYALALDGNKRPCKVSTSNAGHTLFTGIASAAAARRVASNLMRRSSFTGWGIRTLAYGEPRYNPMSYHNGSIWPHDNALIALGFAQYGFKTETAAIFEGLFAASSYQQGQRLPELFCGFTRKPGRGPIAYPVACSPQAWAAATPFALLSACLGIAISHAKEEVHFSNPIFPSFLDELVVRGIRLGVSKLDLRLARHGDDVSVNILRREGTARAITWK